MLLTAVSGGRWIRSKGAYGAGAATGDGEEMAGNTGAEGVREVVFEMKDWISAQRQTNGTNADAYSATSVR
jgi:hypothetical protein